MRSSWLVLLSALCLLGQTPSIRADPISHKRFDLEAPGGGAAMPAESLAATTLDLAESSSTLRSTLDSAISSIELDGTGIRGLADSKGRASVDPLLRLGLGSSTTPAPDRVGTKTRPASLVDRELQQAELDLLVLLLARRHALRSADAPKARGFSPSLAQLPSRGRHLRVPEPCRGHRGNQDERERPAAYRWPHRETAAPDCPAGDWSVSVLDATSDRVTRIAASPSRPAKTSTTREVIPIARTQRSDLVVVPELDTRTLLGFGLVVLAASRRRRLLEAKAFAAVRRLRGRPRRSPRHRHRARRAPGRSSR